MIQYIVAAGLGALIGSAQKGKKKYKKGGAVMKKDPATKREILRESDGIMDDADDLIRIADKKRLDRDDKMGIQTLADEMKFRAGNIYDTAQKKLAKGGKIPTKGNYRLYIYGDEDTILHAFSRYYPDNYLSVMENVANSIFEEQGYGYATIFDTKLAGRGVDGEVGSVSVKDDGKFKPNPMYGKPLIRDFAKGGKTHQFKAGDMYRSDFDYDGMLEFAEGINSKTPRDVMQKFAESAEDVNYHKLATPVFNYLEVDEDPERLKKNMIFELRRAINRRHQKDGTGKRIDEFKYFKKGGTTHKFKAGDMYREDFDYDGMLKFAESISPKTSRDKMRKFAESAQDVNYHDLATPIHHFLQIEEDPERFKKSMIYQLRNSINDYYAENLVKDDKGKIRRVEILGNLAKGGKTQGYNARLDESLAMRRGSKRTKKQGYKSRRHESEGMERSMGRRKYASVGTMDKGNRMMAHGGKTGREVITYNFYNIDGDVIRSGDSIVDYDKETITLPNGKTYKVKEDYEYTMKWQKTQVKAIGGIHGLVKTIKEFSSPDSPFNTSYSVKFAPKQMAKGGCTSCGKRGRKMARGGMIGDTEVQNLDDLEYLFHHINENLPQEQEGYDYDTYLLYFIDPAQGGKIDWEVEFYERDSRGFTSGLDMESGTADSKTQAYKEIAKSAKRMLREANLYRHILSVYPTYARGGKTQGYNARLDESLSMRHGAGRKKEQGRKDRRDESEAMERSMRRRKYASVGTMDKGRKKMAHGGDTGIIVYDIDDNQYEIVTGDYSDFTIGERAYNPSSGFVMVVDEDDLDLANDDWNKVKKLARGGKTQGYNSRLDESLAMRRGAGRTKQQSRKDRRDESAGMERSMGRRKYASVGTMDKGRRKMEDGGMVEYLLYGVAQGKPDYMEEILFVDDKPIRITEKLRDMASAKGFDRLRTSMVNLKIAPDFSKALNFKKGGKTKRRKKVSNFDKLAMKVAARYRAQGMSNKKAMEIGRGTAGKVAREQQAKKRKK